APAASTTPPERVAADASRPTARYIRGCHRGERCPKDGRTFSFTWGVAAADPLESGWASRDHRTVLSDLESEPFQSARQSPAGRQAVQEAFQAARYSGRATAARHRPHRHRYPRPA